MSLYRELIESYEPEFTWNDLYYYNEEIKTLFYTHKEIVNNFENFMCEKKELLDKRIKSDAELAFSPNTEEEASFQEQYREHYYGEAESMLERICDSQRKAFILSIFSLIEGQLKNLSDLISKKIGYNGNRKKIKYTTDGYIEHELEFIENKYQINLSNITEVLETIVKYRNIRNAIAHNNSIFNLDEKEKIPNIEGLRLRTYNSTIEVEISNKKFVLNFIALAEDFLKISIKN